MNKKKYRKPRPSPPKWYWSYSDNCWDCYDRHHCGNCKRMKEFKKYDRTREKKIFRRYKKQSDN